MSKNSSEIGTLKRRAKALALALSLTLVMPALSPLISEAKSDEKKKSQTAKPEKEPKSDKHAKADQETKSSQQSGQKTIQELGKDEQPESVVGLPGNIEKYINQGRWREASQQLEARATKTKVVGRDKAWLAFAYLFLGKNEELKKLSEDAEKESAKSPYTLLVKSFNLTLDGKFEEAEKLLLTLPPQFAGDPLPNFALALVTAKQGKASAAAAYCQKSVELDPGFAWGYRTLGYLEQRWLEDIGKAEEAYAKALAIEPGMTESQDALVDLRLSKNDFDGAIDVAKSAIKSNAKLASNHYRLAQIYTEQWRLRDALAVLQKAIDLDPGNARYFRSRATIKSFQGNLNGAIADQQKAVDLSKDKAFELVELSNMNVLAGNNNRAIDNLSEALKLEPDNATAHDKLYRLLVQEKRFDDLVAEGKRMVERKPKDVRLRMEYAMALNLAKRVDESIEQYKEAAGLTNTDPEPLRRLGALYITKKEWTSAERAYTNALNVNPTSVADLAALGFCYAEDDEYMKAEAAFVTALALQQLTPANQQMGPSKVDLMRSLAGLLYAEGRYSDASSQYETICLMTRTTPQAAMDAFMLARAKAMRDLTKLAAKNLIFAFDKLSPEQKEREAISVAYALVRAGSADDALEQLKQAKITDTNNYQAIEVKARALALKGDLDEAVKVAAGATELKTSDFQQKSDAWFVLSELQLMKKDLAGAEALANKALEAYVKSPEAYCMLGQVALMRDDCKAAIGHAKRALELNPYYPSAYILLGEAQLKAGSSKEAKDSLRKAVELYPGSVEAHKALLQALKKLSLTDEVKHEEEQIVQLESIR